MLALIYKNNKYIGGLVIMCNYSSDLSSLQRMFWTSYNLNPDVPLYLETYSLRFHMKDFNLTDWQSGFNAMVEKHSILRTNFILKDDIPQQFIKDKVDFKLVFIDLSNEEFKEDKLNVCISEISNHPFILTKDILIRISIFNMGEEEYILLINMHHIIMDGWCASIILNDIKTFLKKNEPLLEPAKLQYTDYVLWQKEQLDNGIWNNQRDYWKNILNREISSLVIPSDYLRNTNQHKAGVYFFSISDELLKQLKAVTKVYNTSLYKILLSAYVLLLHFLTEDTNIFVGIPVDARVKREFRKILGCFLNNLPLNIDLKCIETVKELIDLLVNNFNSAMENSDYPISNLLEDIQKSSPYSTMFVQRLSIPNTYGDMVIESLKSYRVAIDLDMVFINYKIGKSRLFEVEYKADLFKEETIARFASYYLKILNEICINQDIRIDELDILSKEEKQMQLDNMGLCNYEYNKEMCIHKMFEEAVKQYQNEIVLSSEDDKLTYSELNSRANTIAYELQNLSNCANVTTIFQRGINAVVAILGVLKLGKAYVPIDPSTPDKRIKYIIKNCESGVVITEKSVYEDNLELFKNLNVRVLILEDYNWETSKNLNLPCSSEDRAYIIYTSGSTGNPKGVAIKHWGVCNHILWKKNKHKFDNKDVCMQFASLAFDASVEEVFTAIISGSRLHIISEKAKYSVDELFKEIKMQGISNCTLPTAFFNELCRYLDADNMGAIDSLRLVFVAGDSLYNDGIVRWKKYSNDKCILVNAYGPTEATICATTYEITDTDKLDNGTIPIGKPLSNMRVYVLRDNLSLCPVNVSGEICISSDALAIEYIKDTEKTSNSFIQNPYGCIGFDRLYKTGDIGKMLSNGELVFIGRKDNQIKYRGFRIETGEIEKCISEYKEIMQVAVVITGEKDKVDLICFYSSKVNYENGSIKEYIVNKLPSYMVPSKIYQIEKMPMNTSLKIDKKALIKLAEDMSMKVVVKDMPSTNTEKQLKEIWTEVLQTKNVGVMDDFFELGGHSIKALQIFTRIKRVFQIDIKLSDLFVYSNIKELSRFIDGSQTNKEMEIKCVEIKDNYELSNAQRRLWFLYKLNPSSTHYNTPFNVSLQGNLEMNLLEKALNKLIDRQESLRTVFEEVDGDPRQRILGDWDLVLDKISLNSMEKEQQQKEIYEYVLKDEKISFNISKGLLIRGAIFKLDEDKFVLYMNMHHIITDGWSMGVFVKEFYNIYTSLKESKRVLDPLKISYKDYANWQNDRINSGKLDNQEKYWIQTLQKPLPILDLPIDKVRPQEQSYNGDMVKFKFGKDICSRIYTICERKKISPFMFLLSSYSLFLHNITQDDDIIVGTPVSGRMEKEFEDLIGFFVNTLPIRIKFKDISDFESLLKYVSERAVDAFNNQEYPLDLLIEKVNPVRDTSRSPIFSTVLVLQNTPLELNLFDLEIKERESVHNISKFDLTLSAVETYECIELNFEYNTDIFNRETILKFCNDFTKLVSYFCEDITKGIYTIDLKSDEEKKSQNFVRTREFDSISTTIPAMFLEQVKLHPNSLAVWDAFKNYTFEELDKAAHDIAKELIISGVKTNTTVAMLMYKSCDTIAAILGILMAGGAYVPIDPSYPEDRINYILKDCESEFLVSESSLKDRVNQISQNLTSLKSTIYVDEIQGTKYTSNYYFNNDLRPEHLAYVIYTSGSTGKPKGVMVTHSNVVTLMQEGKRLFDFGEEDTFTLFHSYCFDFSVWEIFAPLTTGGTIKIVPRDVILDTKRFLRFLKEEKITILNQTPSYFSKLTEEIERLDLRDEDLSKLRYIIFGGEALLSSPVKCFRKNMGSRTKLVNMYGITETTVHTTYYEIPEGDILRLKPYIKIGVPLSYMNIYLLKDDFSECEVNETGEICVVGKGVSEGYLNNKEKTSEVFVKNPFEKSYWQKTNINQFDTLYHSGDLGRMLPDGNLQYMGRKDFQVKIRGFRIELGEIENVLSNLKGVIEGVVVPKQTENENTILEAYYRGSENITVKTIREHLAQKLPDYMIPAHFYRVETIPLNSNGKVDKKKLQNNMGIDKVSLGTDFVIAQTELQKTLCKVIKEILKVDNVGIDDNFFSIGGDSIITIQVVARLNKLNINIRPNHIFKFQTVRELSVFIEDNNLITKEKGKEESISGMVMLSPIQVWFFTQSLENINYFHQCLSFEISEDIEPARLEKSFNSLIKSHGMLRCQYVSDDFTIEQNILSEVEYFKLAYMDLTDKDDMESQTIMCRLELASRNEIDINKYPLMKALLFKTGEEKYKLIWIIHHLIVDGVSWRILVRDLYDSYKNGSIEISKTSYIEYAENISNYAESSDALELSVLWKKYFEKENMIGINEVAAAEEYCEISVNTFGSEERLTLHFNEECSKLIRNNAVEILLRSLRTGLEKWTGDSEMIIDVEGHGRDLSEINLSNTVGWFTNIYPLIVAQDGIKPVPQNGNNFSTLRYLSSNPDIRNNIDSIPRPKLLFNYLGIIATEEGMDNWVLTTNITKDIAKENVRNYVLEFSAAFIEGAIKLDIVYSNKIYSEKEVSLLSSHIKEAVQNIINSQC